MQRTIEIPICNMVITDTGDGSASITSNLHDNPKYKQFNIAMDVIESIVLAHHCAGIDVTTPAYLEGIETAMNACSDQLDEDVD